MMDRRCARPTTLWDDGCARAVSKGPKLAGCGLDVSAAPFVRAWRLARGRSLRCQRAGRKRQAVGPAENGHCGSVILAERVATFSNNFGEKARRWKSAACAPATVEAGSLQEQDRIGFTLDDDNFERREGDWPGQLVDEVAICAAGKCRRNPSG